MNYSVVGIIVVAVIVVAYIICTGQANKWLRYAVSVAEQDLGSGTGKLKLMLVYDMFISKFPVFSKLLPFTVFESLVDTALEWMDYQLENNPNFKAIIKKD